MKSVKMPHDKMGEAVSTIRQFLKSPPMNSQNGITQGKAEKAFKAWLKQPFMIRFWQMVDLVEEGRSYDVQKKRSY